MHATPNLTLALAVVLAACAADPGRDQAAAEAAYLGAQLACVEQATTLEGSRACRADVRRRWGVSDGGRP